MMSRTLNKPAVSLASLTLWALSLLVLGSCNAGRDNLPPRDVTLATMKRCNAYFMEKWPDVGKKLVTDRVRASNIWTRGVYYEGLMALYGIDARQEYYDYAFRWAEFHNWNKPETEQTAYYAEYRCFGPGADTSRRVSWSHQLTDEEAAQYTASNILGAWIDPFIR
jgi:hypothetical protein